MNLATIGLLIAGLALLIIGSEALVRGSSKLAAAFGIPPLVIGLTVVAFGTSSPELAVGVSAALQGNANITLGNVVGSNIFNILAVLGITAALAPNGIAVPRSALVFDIPVMIAGAVAAPPIFFTGYSISRAEGIILLTYYVAYTLFLFLAATEHDALRPYSMLMFGFVVPITILTLVVLAAREIRLHRRGGILAQARACS
jgi:cation:H+ antiporter